MGTSRTPARNGRPPGSPSGLASMTSLMKSWARPCPTGLRPHREHRLGQRWHRSRHRRLRRHLDPQLVAGDRAGGLSCPPAGWSSPPIAAGPTAPGCGCGRPSWLRSPQSRPPHHRAASATRYQQVEQDRTPALLLHHHQLAGRPLLSHEVIIETISAVTTRTGLKVTSVLDTRLYPKGLRIPDKDMKAFQARHLQRHEFHGNWNYTLPASRPRHTRPNHGNIIARH